MNSVRAAFGFLWIGAVSASNVFLLASCVQVPTYTHGDRITPIPEEAAATSGITPALQLPVPLPTASIEPPDTSSYDIGVKEAILAALERNRSLAVERLNVPIQRTQESVQRAAFDPTLSAEVSLEHERVDQISRTTGNRTRTTPDEVSAEASVSEFLPTGTTVQAGLAGDQNRTEGLKNLATTRGDITVTQALLRGAGLNTNLASLKQARLDTLASRYELRGFAESLVAQVESAYWDYALAQMSIGIVEGSLKLARQQLEETEERINVGALARTELAAAQAEVALREEGLIDARSSLETTRLRLLRLINPQGGLQREVMLKDPPEVPEVMLDSVDSHVAVGRKMRPDLNQARLGVERGDLTVVQTRNGLLPKMDLFVTLGKTGYAESFGSSVDGMGGNSYDVTVGLAFQYALGNRAPRAQYEEATLSAEQARDAVLNLDQLVEQDIRTAYIEVNRARQQVTATAATQAFQAEKFRAEREKFQVGRSTSFLVGQAERDLLSAELSRVGAVAAYLKALVNLYRLDGTLLVRRGITAPGMDEVRWVP